MNGMELSTVAGYQRGISILRVYGLARVLSRYFRLCAVCVCL